MFQNLTLKEVIPTQVIQFKAEYNKTYLHTHKDQLYSLHLIFISVVENILHIPMPRTDLVN